MEEEKSDIIARRQPPRRFVYWLAALVLLSLTLWFLWWLFQRPSHGTVSVAPSVEKVNYADPDHRKRYQGKYFTFTYPADFNRREESEAVKYPLLERVYLSRSDIEGRKIALMLQDNTGYRFEEYSSFRIRRDDKRTYQEHEAVHNGFKAAFFTKDTSVFEVSAFLAHGNQVLSVVVSSPISPDGLETEVSTLLDSFQWNEVKNDDSEA
jgi:hypothetical protein